LTQTTGVPPEDLSLNLAQAMATRLCHDLAGMLGTLMGALELAGGDAEMMAEALPVAGDAALQLARRMRLLRFAWGGGTEEVAIGMAQLRELAAGLPSGRRMAVALDDLHPDRIFPVPVARLLLNLLLLGVECLQRDGVVAMEGGQDGAVMITIAGRRAAWPPGFAGQLASADLARSALREADGGRHMQAPLTALIAHGAGIRVSMLMAPQQEQAPPLLIALD
jgi:histidine phosphotransferase ChpT